MTDTYNHVPNASQLADWVTDTRQRTLDLIGDLSEEQLMGPQMDIVNPLLWEIGHVAWFQEKWVLRADSRKKSVFEYADKIWDSTAVQHNSRWNLPLPDREETLSYSQTVRDKILEVLADKKPTEDTNYFVMLSVFHEDMHTEAFTYTRQTLSYSAPNFTAQIAGPLNKPSENMSEVNNDADIPGGVFMLGSPPESTFVFDNEKWAHAVELRPFAIARTVVTQKDYADFVDDGGYSERNWWSDYGWNWREGVKASHPVYWRKDDNRVWVRRHFDNWVPLEPNQPVINVNWHEANAYCRWAKRRLPTETEWEAAAAAEPNIDRNEISLLKRYFPWGSSPPTPAHANLDWQAMGCVDATALGEGASAFGCRGMLGNVWEWTSCDFLPYPGFTTDPYKEYSEPWFSTRKVLRGGCWATRGRLLRNTWRNFYTPDRRDVWAGFRTCSLEK